MAYEAPNLSVLAYANSFTLWHYITEKDDPTVKGYWNNATCMLRANDVITTNWQGRTDSLVVTGNDGSSVTVCWQNQQAHPQEKAA